MALRALAGTLGRSSVARPPGLALEAGTRWTLRAGAFLLPLAYCWTTVDQFALPKLVLARLLALCLFALWLAGWLRTGTPRLRRTPLDLPLLAFITSATVSTALAVNRSVAVFGTYLRYEGLLTLLTYAALFWLVSQALTTRAEVRGLLRSLLAGAYVAAVVAVLQSVVATALGTVGPAETGFTFGGWVRASGTFGNANFLGILLAMMLPVAVDGTLRERSGLDRALHANAVAVLVLALLLTFSRSAWLGAAAGVALAMWGPLSRSRRARAGALAGALLLLVVPAALAGSPAGRAVAARLVSLANPVAGTGSTRLHIWAGTVRMIDARPLLGWGPDTFGLVYPEFRTGDWTPGAQVDRAHSDLLDVAAARGLLGAATYLATLAALALAFWRGRRQEGALAALGTVVAYEIPLQVNFAWVPVTAVFWILAAAAVATWTPPPPMGAGPAPMGGRSRAAVALAAASGLGVLTALTVGSPLLADMRFFEGVEARAHGDTAAARARVAQARTLAPEEATYAGEAGDLALDLQPDGEPGPGADWAAARAAYLDAISLGTSRAATYERLAAADRALGRDSEAEAAALGSHRVRRSFRPPRSSTPE